MGHGYKHGAGGTSLNFNVKTYPSETELKADKPRENTIGVITTTTMTSWVFSATEPKEPVVGNVWFSVDKTSNVEFNALKKNTLQVYPFSAKQYEGGKWVEKTAYIYQNEEWKDWWNGQLFVNGNQWENITGGWSYDGYVSSAYAGSIVDGKLQLYGKSGGMVTIGTQKMIDITEYSYIEATFEIISRGTATKAIGIDIEKVKGTSVAYLESKTPAGQTGIERLDISGYSGEYFVGSYANDESACKGTISEIKLIR